MISLLADENLDGNIVHGVLRRVCGRQISSHKMRVNPRGNSAIRVPHQLRDALEVYTRLDQPAPERAQQLVRTHVFKGCSCPGLPMEQQLEALRQALIAGEQSGTDSPLDMDEIRREARQEAGLNV